MMVLVQVAVAHRVNIQSKFIDEVIPINSQDKKIKSISEEKGIELTSEGGTGEIVVTDSVLEHAIEEGGTKADGQRGSAIMLNVQDAYEAGSIMMCGTGVLWVIAAFN